MKATLQYVECCQAPYWISFKCDGLTFRSDPGRRGRTYGRGSVCSLHQLLQRVVSNANVAACCQTRFYQSILCKT